MVSSSEGGSGAIGYQFMWLEYWWGGGEWVACKLGFGGGVGIDRFFFF